MPKYQYQCKDCGEALEVQQSFTEDALTVCPTCGGNLRKVFNAVGVVFKGSGFYKTDSRSGSSSTDAAKPAASTTSSGGTSSESSSSSTSASSAASSSGSSSSKSTSSGSDSAA